VLVIEQNFDVGGKLVHSGGWTSLGGGDPIQERDRMGTDPQGLGLKASLVKPEDLEDDPDRLFRDMTDWSVVDATGVARYRYNDRELHRAWADNAPKTRQFMMDNYVRFARIDGTHQGGGMTRARAAADEQRDEAEPPVIKACDARLAARAPGVGPKLRAAALERFEERVREDGDAAVRRRERPQQNDLPAHGRDV
jgi:hypothetical protein